MATVDAIERKKDKLRSRVCPCGKPKSPNHFRCVECMEKRGGWADLPIVPELPWRLPVSPLFAAVQKWLGNNTCYGLFDQPVTEQSIAAIGLGIRRFNEWQAGRAYWVSVDIADRVLTGLGLDWLDVWTREEHPRFAACLDAIDALGEAPADAFCPECCEPVATLNGTCPWHRVPVVCEPYLESEAAA